MKNFKNEMINRIPQIALTFMIGILLGAICNILQNSDSSGYCLFSVEFAGFCIGVYIVTYLVDLIPFHHYTAYHIVNALSCYIFFMGYAYFFRFFGFSLSNIISNTLSFIGIYTILTFYIIHDYRRKSQQINNLIEKNQQ